jgi:hypothetical protein
MANKSRITLTTVESVVEALGGTKATAEWSGLGMPAVSNWIARGWIPPEWYLALSAELESRGFKVDPALFRHKPVKAAG